MLFKHSEDKKKFSLTWMNKRYGIIVQRRSKLAVDCVVAVMVSRDGKGDYETMYPRFEAEDHRHADLVLGALITGMRELQEDAPESQVQELLDYISREFKKMYGHDRATRTQIVVPQIHIPKHLFIRNSKKK